MLERLERSAYLPAAARRFMYSSKDSDLGMCVCLALGSLGSRAVGFGSRVCGLVSAHSWLLVRNTFKDWN